MYVTNWYSTFFTFLFIVQAQFLLSSEKVQTKFAKEILLMTLDISVWEFWPWLLLVSC